MSTSSFNSVDLSVAVQGKIEMGELYMWSILFLPKFKAKTNLFEICIFKIGEHSSGF